METDIRRFQPLGSTGANSTLNKGATGLPLRASAVVGHEEGRGRERERDSILCIEM